MDTDNLDALIDLEPFESQQRFVADNIFSIAEACANITNGRYAQPFGIYDGDTPVGFLMIGYDIAGEEADRKKFLLLDCRNAVTSKSADGRFAG